MPAASPRHSTLCTKMPDTLLGTGLVFIWAHRPMPETGGEELRVVRDTYTHARTRKPAHRSTISAPSSLVVVGRRWSSSFSCSAKGSRRDSPVMYLRRDTCTEPFVLTLRVPVVVSTFHVTALEEPGARASSATDLSSPCDSSRRNLPIRPAEISHAKDSIAKFEVHR